MFDYKILEEKVNEHARKMWEGVEAVTLIAKAYETDFYVFDVVLNDDFKGAYYPYTPRIYAEYDYETKKLYLDSYIRCHDRHVVETMDDKVAKYATIPDKKLFEDDDGNLCYCARLGDGKRVKVAVPPISISSITVIEE